MIQELLTVVLMSLVVGQSLALVYFIAVRRPQQPVLLPSLVAAQVTSQVGRQLDDATTQLQALLSIAQIFIYRRADDQTLLDYMHRSWQEEPECKRCRASHGCSTGAS